MASKLVAMACTILALDTLFPKRPEEHLERNHHFVWS